MNTKRTTLSLAAVAAGLVLTGCGGGSKSDKTIAIVNGERITLEQFNKYMASKPTMRVIVQGEVVELPVAQTIALQSLQDMVSRVSLYQLATDEGVMPKSEDVAKEVEFQKRLNPDFVKNYQARGMANDQIRDEVKFNLAQERLFTKGITVDDSTVEKWIKEHPEAFVDPAKAGLLVVLVANAAEKTQVDAALAKGKSFKDVALEFSRMKDAKASQGKFNGGRPVALSGLALAVREAIAKTDTRQATAWVSLPEGAAKFYVESKTKEVALEQTAERRENIRRSIAIKQGQEGKDLRRRLLDKVRKSDIKVEGSDAFTEAWKQFMDALNSQTDAPAKPGDATKPAEK